MSKESKLLKNTAIIAIGNVCTKCVSFFMLPLYTTILSTKQYGTVDLLSTYTSLLMIILTLQLEQGVFRQLIDARNDQKKQKRYITDSCILVFVAVFIFSVLSAIILSFLHYRYTFYLIAISGSGAFTSIALQIPRGLGNNYLYAIGSFLSGSLNVIFNVLFVAVFRLGVVGMLLATLLSLIIACGFIFLKLKIWQYIHISLFDKQCLKELLQYSLPLVPYTLCWWIISASDRMLIGIFLGTAYNGIYAAAYKFPTLFSTVTNIFQLSWTESASENVGAKDRDEYYNNVFDKTIRFYSAVNMGIIALMPFAFNVLIGNSFKDAYYYIPILLCSALFHSIAALYGSLYFALKKTKKVSTTTILAAVINFVINIAFINFIGLYAAAISSLVAYVAITIIRHFDIRSIVNISFDKKYVLGEGIIYILLFGTYYVRNNVLSFISFIIVLIHCTLRNREFLSSMFSYGLQKARERVKKK